VWWGPRTPVPRIRFSEGGNVPQMVKEVKLHKMENPRGILCPFSLEKLILTGFLPFLPKGRLLPEGVPHPDRKFLPSVQQLLFRIFFMLEVSKVFLSRSDGRKVSLFFGRMCVRGDD